MFSRLTIYFSSFTNKVDSLDLRNIFKPFYILLSIFGLFPYSVKLHNNKHGFKIIQKSIYINSLCAISNVLIICAFLAFHIRYIYTSLEYNSMTEAIMTQMNYIVELLSFTMVSIVTYICVFINRFKYVKILNAIATLAPNIKSVHILSELRFQINFVVMGSLLLTLIMQFCVNFTRPDSLWRITLAWFSFNFPQMIQFTTIAFFYILILMVVAILKNIREQTTSLMKEKIYTRDCFTKLECRQPAITLRQIELVYVKVFEIKQDVNQAFEASILLTMMQCFHSIVSATHLIYHGIVVHRTLDTHGIINCFIWISFQMMKIYVISNAGKVFTLQALKLGQALHNIPTEKLDIRLLMEIQHFSSMMTFQCNDLTVYGYFSLDATLIFKVIASAAMYVIILVQFDKRN